MASDIFGDIYKEMGAKPIINAIGSVTLLGGSTPKPIVKEAMDRADSAYVNLPHLQEVVGKKIAEYCNVPAGFVTSGAGAGLALTGAAFMAGLKIGAYKSLKDISKNWNLDKKFSPKMNKKSRKTLLTGWSKAIKRALIN